MCKWILYLADLDQSVYSFLKQKLNQIKFEEYEVSTSSPRMLFFLIRILLFCHGSIYGHNKNVSLFENFT